MCCGNKVFYDFYHLPNTDGALAEVCTHCGTLTIYPIKGEKIRDPYICQCGNCGCHESFYQKIIFPHGVATLEFCVHCGELSLSSSNGLWLVDDEIMEYVAKNTIDNPELFEQVRTLCRMYIKLKENSGDSKQFIKSKEIFDSVPTKKSENKKRKKIYLKFLKKE